MTNGEQKIFYWGGTDYLQVLFSDLSLTYSGGKRDRLYIKMKRSNSFWGATNGWEGFSEVFGEGKRNRNQKIFPVVGTGKVNDLRLFYGGVFKYLEEYRELEIVCCKLW